MGGDILEIVYLYNTLKARCCKENQRNGTMVGKEKGEK